MPPPPPRGEPAKIESFRSLEALYSRIKDLELEGASRFSSSSKEKYFGVEADSNILQNHVVRFELSASRSATLQIEYDGIPFIIVARRYFTCQWGKAKLPVHGVGTDAMAVSCTGRRPNASTKKVDCPVRLLAKHIVKFPEFRLSGEKNSYKMRKASKALYELVKSGKDLTGHYYHEFYMTIPSPEEHQGHSTSGVRAGFRPDLDPRVVNVLKETVQLGVNKVSDIKTIIKQFVNHDLFHGQKEKPHRLDKKYFPTHVDITKYVERSILSRRDKTNTEKLVTKWQQCMMEDFIFFRGNNDGPEIPYIPVAKHLPKTLMKVDIIALKQMSQQQYGAPLIFCYQSVWQKRLMLLFGNQMTYLDPVYLSLPCVYPLYFLTVLTNVGYMIVGVIILEKQSRELLQEALTIFRNWNPDWKPSYIMVGPLEEDANVVQALFKGSRLFINDDHRERTWQSWQDDTIDDIGNKGALIAMMKEIATAPCREKVKKSLEAMRESNEAWNGDEWLWQCFTENWEKRIKQWTVAYRDKVLDLRMNAGHVIDPTHKPIRPHRNSPVSTMISTLLKSYLPDSYRRYTAMNVGPLSNPKAARKLPRFMASSPNSVKDATAPFVTMAATMKSGQIVVMDKEPGLYSVQVNRGDGHDVCLGSSDKMPACSCKYWSDTKLPCCHFFAVVNSVRDVGWENFSTLYLECLLFQSDRQCQTIEPYSKERFVDSDLEIHESVLEEGQEEETDIVSEAEESDIDVNIIDYGALSDSPCNSPEPVAVEILLPDVGASTSSTPHTNQSKLSSVENQKVVPSSSVRSAKITPATVATGPGMSTPRASAAPAVTKVSKSGYTSIQIGAVTSKPAAVTSANTSCVKSSTIANIAFSAKKVKDVCYDGKVKDILAKLKPIALPRVTASVPPVSVQNASSGLIPHVVLASLASGLSAQVVASPVSSSLSTATSSGPATAQRQTAVSAVVSTFGPTTIQDKPRITPVTCTSGIPVQIGTSGIPIYSVQTSESPPVTTPSGTPVVVGDLTPSSLASTSTGSPIPIGAFALQLPMCSIDAGTPGLQTCSAIPGLQIMNAVTSSGTVPLLSSSQTCTSSIVAVSASNKSPPAMSTASSAGVPALGAATSSSGLPLRLPPPLAHTFCLPLNDFLSTMGAGGSPIIFKPLGADGKPLSVVDLSQLKTALSQAFATSTTDSGPVQGKVSSLKPSFQVATSVDVTRTSSAATAVTSTTLATTPAQPTALSLLKSKRTPAQVTTSTSTTQSSKENAPNILSHRRFVKVTLDTQITPQQPSKPFKLQGASRRKESLRRDSTEKDEGIGVKSTKTQKNMPEVDDVAGDTELCEIDVKGYDSDSDPAFVVDISDSSPEIEGIETGSTVKVAGVESNAAASSETVVTRSKRKLAEEKHSTSTKKKTKPDASPRDEATSSLQSSLKQVGDSETKKTSSTALKIEDEVQTASDVRAKSPVTMKEISDQPSKVQTIATGDEVKLEAQTSGGNAQVMNMTLVYVPENRDGPQSSVKSSEPSVPVSSSASKCSTTVTCPVSTISTSPVVCVKGPTSGESAQLMNMTLVYIPEKRMFKMVDDPQSSPKSIEPSVPVSSSASKSSTTVTPPVSTVAASPLVCVKGPIMTATPVQAIYATNPVSVATPAAISSTQPILSTAPSPLAVTQSIPTALPPIVGVTPMPSLRTVRQMLQARPPVANALPGAAAITVSSTATSMAMDADPQQIPASPAYAVSTPKQTGYQLAQQEIPPPPTEKPKRKMATSSTQTDDIIILDPPLPKKVPKTRNQRLVDKCSNIWRHVRDTIQLLKDEQYLTQLNEQLVSFLAELRQVVSVGRAENLKRHIKEEPVLVESIPGVETHALLEASATPAKRRQIELPSVIEETHVVIEASATPAKRRQIELPSVIEETHVVIEASAAPAKRRQIELPSVIEEVVVTSAEEANTYYELEYVDSENENAIASIQLEEGIDHSGIQQIIDAINVVKHEEVVPFHPP
ncbi:mucin-4-like isoform X2 [Lineus longissimus]|uniref:mucin-4-like isoform X2 n=1 Tax=Lineus longissimus TaxID=88925 RepID=UPI00315DFD0F